MLKSSTSAQKFLRMKTTTLAWLNTACMILLTLFPRNLSLTLFQPPCLRLRVPLTPQLGAPNHGNCRGRASGSLWPNAQKAVPSPDPAPAPPRIPTLPSGPRCCASTTGQPAPAPSPTGPSPHVYAVCPKGPCFCRTSCPCRAFLVARMVKNLPVTQETQVQ